MIKDLAEIHGLVSKCFEWPSTKEEWELYRLSKEQVQHFHEFGYVAGIKLLDSERVEQLRKELEEIIKMISKFKSILKF